jgi:hypothetical protein
MALKVYTTNLGLQWNPTPTFSPRFSPRTLRYKSRKLFECSRSSRDVSVNGSNLVDEQQQVSFTEPENQLVEALIGIQGRGRSASPQQLSVKCLQNSIYIYIYIYIQIFLCFFRLLFIFHFWWYGRIFAGCWACRASSGRFRRCARTGVLSIYIYILNSFLLFCFVLN